MVVQAFLWEGVKAPSRDACGHAQHVLPEQPPASSRLVEKEDFF